jgi:hypothetical protein
MTEIKTSLLIALLLLAGCCPTINQKAQDENLAKVEAQLLEAQEALAKEKQNVLGGKVVLGWIEHAKISQINSPVKVKLDPGAKTSSVGADIIKTFKRDGKKYVLYRLLLGEESEEIFESEIVRWVKIKNKTGGFVKRPVITMDICIDKLKLRHEVNLAERERFNYPVLIGRNMLKKVLVDSAKTFESEPHCD